MVDRNARRQDRTPTAALELVLTNGERLHIGSGVDAAPCVWCWARYGRDSPVGQRAVYLCLMPCDMRKSSDSLHALVRDYLELDALDGHLFVFTSRRRDRVRILYWDRDGFAVWSKRLEEGTYAIPFGEGEVERRREITTQELGSLLTSIHLSTAKRRKRCRRAALIVVVYLESGRFPDTVPIDPNSCHGMQKRCGRSLWVWPSNYPSRTSIRPCFANCWRRSATIRASSCRKSNRRYLRLAGTKRGDQMRRRRSR